MYGLLMANAVSLFGTRLSMIAIPWFVISSTGSPALTGVVAAAQMGPYVIAKALAGPLIDRLGPRRVVVAADIASGVSVAVIPVLYLLDTLEIGVLIGAVAILGAVSGPADGGKSALIPIVADDARVPLERITGLDGTIERLATTLGAAGAGTLVALIGAIPALWVTTVTFIAAALVIAATTPRAILSSDGQTYLADLRAALVFIGRDRLLRSLYAMISVTNLLDAALFAVLLPVWAHETGYGPAVIGLLSGGFGGAAICSSLLAAAIGHRLPRRMTYLLGFLITGLPRFVVLAIDVPLPVAVATFAIAGLGSGVLNPILGAVIFERIPRAAVGRVSAMGSSLAWIGIPFGSIAGGALITASGLAAAMLICGIVYFAVTTVPGLQREWREMDVRAGRNDSG
ncbi:MFS transporter [uncultured Agrococcus sp.]|uniref:MFS transporter n=1 Tax=uncultured Agrococcus sp. TaxID=382258 RepID=UPI0025FDE8D7|nr:MFS transporter [uncultured Agrococcus sp.]